MYFLGQSLLPEAVLPPPDMRNPFERAEDARRQLLDVAQAVQGDEWRNQRSNSEQLVEREAYDLRIADVERATGIKLRHPQDVAEDMRWARGEGNAEGQTVALREDFDKAAADFANELRNLTFKHPDKASVIRADVPISNDVLRLRQGAERRMDDAFANAKDLGTAGRVTAALMGGAPGMVGDPVNLGAMMVQPEVGFGRTLFGRVMVRAVTEGAVNAGAEAVIQTLAEDGKRKAGLSTDGFWTQIGIAAAFGGGLGGLSEAAGHVFKLRGRTTPDTDAALQRMARGEVSVEDARLVADAAGAKLADDDLASLSRALDADADYRAVVPEGVDARLVDDMTRAVAEGTPPPVLREGGDAQFLGRQIPDNAMSQPQAGIAPEIVAQDIAVPLRDDPGFTAYVAEQNAVRLKQLEDDIAMNEADIAHLRDDGDLASLPSERDFSGVRASDDVDRANRVLQKLDEQVTARRAEIAAGPKFSVDDVGVQKRFADARGARRVLPPEVKAQKLGEVHAVAAQEQALQRLTAAGGARPAGKAKPEELVARTSLDVMDGLPAGTDAEGRAVMTTHAEMSDAATRMNDLADVIAACRAA